jgi:Fe-S-cluster containining protein
MLLLTWPVIDKLIRQSAARRKELAQIYRQLPQTRCQRKTYCCSMLPEMTLIEALAILGQMAVMNSEERLALLKKISSYFFLNAVRISACPFLDGNTCLVYEIRFFGCRAYGLWSPEHYHRVAARSQAAKKYLQQQWQALDVKLPQEVIDFTVPYCPDVQAVESVALSDVDLVEKAAAVESISLYFSDAHQSFHKNYYADFSFVVAAMHYGHRRAVHIKFDVVKEIVQTGRSKKLSPLLDEFHDPFKQSEDPLENLQGD